MGTHSAPIRSGGTVGNAHRRRPTLKDVARASGVSVTTAHVALTDRRDGVRVTEATRERVRQVAEDLGYQPNILARSLKTSRTSTIGFISDEVTTTPFAVSMLAAAQDEAARRGFLLFVVNLGVGAPTEVQQRALDLLLQQQVAGVIYACMYHRIVTPPPGLPPQAVFLNAAAASGGYRGIVPDERQGAYDAVKELIGKGHRRIAYLDDVEAPVASGLRREGYVQALTDAGIVPDPRLHLQAPPRVRGGLKIADFLDLPPRAQPTAIFCFNDRQAMGAYRAARQRGLEVPDDLSIVGFDDQEFIASELDPPLTTVRLPHRYMGHLAVELLLGDADSRQDEAGKPITKVRCPLVRRDSVAPPRPTADTRPSVFGDDG
jgi:LacI family transcriptional regulator